jgi:hypothetical protein
MVNGPPDDEYRVGYRKPPQHSRFKPGRSGNSRGKPPGTKNALTLLKQALLTSVQIKQNGRETKTTKLRAILMRLVNRAVQGDYASIRLLLQYGLDRELREPSAADQGLSDATVARLRRVLFGIPDESHNSDSSDKQQESSAATVSSASNQRLRHQIGYRKPPLHSRFQKGRSGNPAGRPRVPKNVRTHILQLLDGEVSFSENGQKRTVSRRQVIFTQIVNKAALGDVRFQALLLQYATSINLTVCPSRLRKNLAFLSNGRYID